ncbi:MAG: cytochrome bd-I ubiquinol oxidase subunit CydA [Zetaproteobacteria bacterium]|nr:MAG: cytochrome bd-I ubiquinol oxidase subunit CydA [Zetaproteobacteria bacterium]
MTDMLVDVSRLQFALTALFHFVFVPLTLGLSFLLVIMETVYVITGKEIYKEMTQFWGKLFGINFAMGVATGLTMEFQFGTNWAYYSHYVGDIFGVPLAIEGMMAFFLESTFVGLFFVGWKRLTKYQHLLVTFLVALGSNLSALWILIANGWMQNPVGAVFNPDTMRMELDSFTAMLFNPVAQAKFVHTVSAGYTTGSVFVLAISAWYLLKGRHLAFARRSFAVAAGFGLAAITSAIVLGDESGYTVGDVQKAKLAAIEAEWETAKPPASFTVIGIPNQETMETEHAIRIPWLLGLIATRSVDEPVEGLKDIIARNEARIKRGIHAVLALRDLQLNRHDEHARATLLRYQKDLGYGLLLTRYTADIAHSTPEEIHAAALHSVPRVAPLFFTFRIMVASGFAMLILFLAAAWSVWRNNFMEKRWLLKAALWSLPLPWLAAELGWFVAEYGRQPWTISGILPTSLSASSLSATQVTSSLIAFILFYTGLTAVEMFLMIKYARKGPDALHAH